MYEAAPTLGRQLKELREEIWMALDSFVKLISGPEITCIVISPGPPGSASGVGADRLRDHEDQLVRLLLGRQGTELLDLRTCVRRSECLHPLALEDDAAAVLPRHHVAPALAPCLAEMLGPRVALASYEPQTEALEVERRELLEW